MSDRWRQRTAVLLFLGFAAATGMGLLMVREVPVQVVEQFCSRLIGEGVQVPQALGRITLQAGLRMVCLYLFSMSPMGRLSCLVVYARLCVQGGFVLAVLLRTGDYLPIAILCILFGIRLAADWFFMAKGCMELLGHREQRQVLLPRSVVRLSFCMLLDLVMLYILA